jgi:N-acetylmuramoyl-L-alanine amidase
MSSTRKRILFMVVCFFLLIACFCMAESSDVNDRLIIAVNDGNIQAVEDLLTFGADVNLRMTEGITPLFIASQKGHTEIVKLLLEKGAQVDVKDTEGTTPLFIASQKGHTEIVKLLLEKGAQVDAKDTEGTTPLDAASSKGHTEIVKLLLEKGADVKMSVLIDKDREYKILIDPGHGGKDIGAVGHFGLKEKDVNLDIALRMGDYLKKELKKNPNVKMYMTRNTDTEMTLEERVQMARDIDADVFFSIHVNSTMDRTQDANGFETYYSGTKENLVFLPPPAFTDETDGDSAVSSTLVDSSTTSAVDESRILADFVQERLAERLTTPDRGTKRKSYYVLKHTNSPAILTKIDFISNPNVELNLRDGEVRQAIAETLGGALMDYLMFRNIHTATDKHQKDKETVSGSNSKDSSSVSCIIDNFQIKDFLSNYEIIDLEWACQLFAQKRPDKGEFETTGGYQKRLESLMPSPDTIYASKFTKSAVIRVLELKYNADNNLLKVAISSEKVFEFDPIKRVTHVLLGGMLDSEKMQKEGEAKLLKKIELQKRKLSNHWGLLPVNHIWNASVREDRYLDPVSQIQREIELSVKQAKAELKNRYDLELWVLYKPRIVSSSSAKKILFPFEYKERLPIVISESVDSIKLKNNLYVSLNNDYINAEIIEIFLFNPETKTRISMYP